MKPLPFLLTVLLARTADPSLSTGAWSLVYVPDTQKHVANADYAPTPRSKWHGSRLMRR